MYSSNRSMCKALHCGRRGAHEPVERKQKRLTGQTPTFINKIRFEVYLDKLLLLYVKSYRVIIVVIGVWCICRLNWFDVVLEAKVLKRARFSTFSLDSSSLPFHHIYVTPDCRRGKKASSPQRRRQSAGWRSFRRFVNRSYHPNEPVRRSLT